MSTRRAVAGARSSCPPVGAVSIIRIFEIDMTRAGGVLENRGIFTAVLDLVNGAGLTEGGSSVEARPVPCGPRVIPKRADVNFLEFASGGRARVRLRTGAPPSGADLCCHSQREFTCERAGEGTQTAHKNSNGERRERTPTPRQRGATGARRRLPSHRTQRDQSRATELVVSLG